jgi:Mce-associated membrane protein
VLPALVALLLVAALVAGALAVVQRGRASDRADRAADEQAAVAAARKVATALDTYDYQDLDASFDTVIAAATEPFKSQYASTSSQLKDLLVQYHAKATSSIVAAGVAGHTGDTVTVLLFVDQTVTNASSPQPRSDRNRLQLVMRKVEGRFLVAEAQLL